MDPHHLAGNAKFMENMDAYEQAFIENEIDGATMSGLDKDSLWTLVSATLFIVAKSSRSGTLSLAIVGCGDSAFAGIHCPVLSQS